MELKKPAVAGTMESSDIMVTLRPNEGRGIVTDAVVAVVDKGALDFVIRARMQCAVCRAAEVSYDWGKEDPNA